MTDVPAPIRSHLRTLQPEWQAWLEWLPGAREAAVERWGLTLGPVVSQSVGSAVYHVTRRGRPAVLKLVTPGEFFDQQVATMTAAKGRGYAHVYESDLPGGAVLMERLGRSLDEEWRAEFGNVPGEVLLGSVPVEPHLHERTQTLIEAWKVPLSVAPEVDAESHKAAQLGRLVESLHASLGLDDVDAVVQRALLFAEQRLQARQPDRQVVCHGDPHEGNLLRVLSPRPGAPADAVWVDPDGFRCEPDYDLGVAVRSANKFVLASDDPVVMLRGWCARLADQTGTDAEAIWQWGFLERVSTGLYLLDRGLVDRGRRYLQAARWLISRRSFG